MTKVFAEALTLTVEQNLSSDSDGDTNETGGKQLLRKVSTKKQLKSRTCIKEGFLLKQTSSSFQRWRSHYFKLRPRRIFYAKHENSDIFNEVDLTDSSVAERSTKNINCSFSIIGSSCRLILCAESRKEMDEWISAIKAVQAGEFYWPHQLYMDNFSDGHNWYACTHNRPTFCNVCREVLPGVMNHGLSCDVCKFKAHKRCAARALNNCKWATLAAVGKNVIEDEEGVWIPHQWLEGNLPVSAKCAVCDKTCGSVLRLQDWKCLWCRSVVHTACRNHMSSKCGIGSCKLSIVPPTAIHSQDGDGFWQAVPSAQCTSPLLVFVNSKSGDNQGVKFLRRFRQFLNPAQVFDLMCSGPQVGLKMFRKFDTFRILICGGDGSVGWVLNELDKLNMQNKAQVGVLPLGTGNDLAQVMGWGNVCDDDTQVPAIIERYERASAKLLDRWSVKAYEGKTPIPMPLATQTPEDSNIAMTEYEHTVADHLATILQSNKHPEIISSSAVLCETIKDFVAKVGKLYADDNSEVTQKCKILDEKLESLLNALNQESKLAEEHSLKQQMMKQFAASVQIHQERKEEVEPTAKSPAEEKTQTDVLQSENVHKLTTDEDITSDSAAPVKVNVTLPGQSPDQETNAQTVKYESGQKKSVSRVFEERSQLMLRANSLKKAVRQIIEHTEKAVDEQNDQTKLKKLPVRIEEEPIDTMTSTTTEVATTTIENLSTALNIVESTTMKTESCEPPSTLSVPECRPSSRSAPTTPIADMEAPIFYQRQTSMAVGGEGNTNTRRANFASLSASGPSLSERRITIGSRYPDFATQRRHSQTIINPLYQRNARGSFLGRMLLQNADTLCAAATPMLEINDHMFDHMFTEKCVMNSYFGIGLDAKISLDFHRKREEHPKKCSRTKNMVWYGLLATKEFAMKTYKNLEQRIKLECDGEEISLPPLQGIVVLNTTSYMGGANFWGIRSANEIFLAPSYDDKLLEVVAVFNTVQLGMAIVVPDGVLQHHRIAQCRSVKITILGDEHVPLQTDGEAWLQPPGIVKIEHKNRVQMLARDRRLEVALKSWKDKQRFGIDRHPSSEFLTDNESLLLSEFAETVAAVASSINETIAECSHFNGEIDSIVSNLLRLSNKLRPIGPTSDSLNHQLAIEFHSLVRDLSSQLNLLLSRKAGEIGNDRVEKIINWMDWLDVELKKLRDIRWLPQVEQTADDQPTSSTEVAISSKPSGRASGRFRLAPLFKKTQKKESF
uniref:Diacylglycerol kinase n=1 Tax=Phallusia mammillata TaxID=59560 RepID=A0A6F9DBM1_9ASCI|nr:diacylglycerol kinase delta [Phallusia mammillata]